MKYSTKQLSSMNIKTKKVVSTSKRTKTSGSIALPSMISLVSKHEQAFLVILAYVIGFTTAFIAFKLSDDSRFYDSLAANSHDTTSESRNEVSVSIKNGDLVLKNGDRDRVVSAKSYDSNVEDGFHREVMSAAVSPNGRFLHYCVEMDAEADSCVNFVYSVNNDTIYRVKDQSGQIESGEEALSDSGWLADGRLHLFNKQSVGADKPWQMAD